jgi:murein DD-endopeptidase MepM/ murein hydrolase activator NlpD
MSFYVGKKNNDPMKIKKFYYYSPDKLKLVPIQNFIPKSVIFLIGLTIFLISVSLMVGRSIFSNTTPEELTQKNILLEKKYEEELDKLTQKYITLANQFNKIAKTTNDVRLAVNLEPISLENRDYGIGGSEFYDLSKLSPENLKGKFGEIYNFVNTIETNLKYETSNYEEINNKFEENKELFDNLPALRPVNSSFGDRFGMRYHPILKSRRMHHGLDFLSNTGEEVIAPGNGVVTYIGNKGGYGKTIRINHGFGYETIYAHLSKYKVKKGQKVKRGDVIALSGNSGSLSTGPHLHYEVRHNSVCLNPRNFIFEETKIFEETSKSFLASR